MKMIRSPLERKWEFETSEGYLADLFLQTLKLFRIKPEDIYIPSFLDMSDIEFRTTKAKKEQIDYVFKRLVDKNSYDDGLSLVELEGGDWYAIY